MYAYFAIVAYDYASTGSLKELPGCLPASGSASISQFFPVSFDRLSGGLGGLCHPQTGLLICSQRKKYGWANLLEGVQIHWELARRHRDGVRATPSPYPGPRRGVLAIWIGVHRTQREGDGSGL